MSVVEGRKEVEYLRYLGDSSRDNVTGERDVSHRGSKKMIAGGRGRWNAAVEGIEGINVRRKRFAAPNRGFLWVEKQPYFRAGATEKVKDDLKILAAADECAVVKEESMKEVGTFILETKKKRVKNEREEERCERISLLGAG